MPSLYVSEDLKDDLEQAQDIIEDDIGFRPDKVEVLNRAMDDYFEKLKKRQEA